jgi:hypothetical protein
MLLSAMLSSRFRSSILTLTLRLIAKLFKCLRMRKTRPFSSGFCTDRVTMIFCTINRGDFFHMCMCIQYILLKKSLILEYSSNLAGDKLLSLLARRVSLPLRLNIFLIEVSCLTIQIVGNFFDWLVDKYLCKPDATQKNQERQQK